MMNYLQTLISHAISESSPKILAGVEDIMRHDIWHSTLDWQTEDQLIWSAREAWVTYQEQQS